MKKAFSDILPGRNPYEKFSRSTHQGIGVITFLKEHWVFQWFLFCLECHPENKRNQMQVMEAKIQMRKMGLEYFTDMRHFFLVNQLVNVYLPTVAWFGNLIGEVCQPPWDRNQLKMETGMRNWRTLVRKRVRSWKIIPKIIIRKIFSHGFTSR